MSDKLSLEHTIRNIAEGKTTSDESKVSLEHAIRNIHEGIGIGGKDKPEGTPSAFLNRHYHSQGGNVGGRFAGNHTAAGKGVTAKQKQADPIKMESAPSDMSGVTLGIQSEDGKKKKVEETSAPNYGDAATVSQWPAAEDGKKKIKEETGPGSEGTVERVKIKNVARFKDFGPKSSGSTLSKTGQIKTKIIDEDKDCECEKSDIDDKKTKKDKMVKGKSPIELNPELKAPPIDSDVREETVDEGKILDTAKKMGRVAGVVGALGAHAGKTYDAANIATHSDDPGLAAATIATYANPHSRMLNMLPTAFKADKAGAGEDEFKRQQKFKKQQTQKEETDMTDEVNNPLIDAFFKLQSESGNMFEAAKHLSDKQKKIAAVAGDKSKIDAADFAALRAGKKVEEEIEEIDEVKFSPEELAHFEAVAKEDPTAKGSFKKAGTNPNGDPVRPTIPERDLTDDVNINEGMPASVIASKKKYAEMSDEDFAAKHSHKSEKELRDMAARHGYGWNKATKTGSDHYVKRVAAAKKTNEEVIDEARGRPKKVADDEPAHQGRDPKQHIQVVAGQAAAGRHIEFKHNDGSTTTITPQHGRKIVAHLNSLKPAERHAAVNKMHDSSKGM